MSTPDIHWSDADDRDVERWYEERVERAGGELFFHAEWAARDSAWGEKVREVCAQGRGA